MKNTTGLTLNTLDIAYDILYRNDGNRSSTLNFSHAAGPEGIIPAVFTDVAALNFSTPAASSGTSVVTVNKSETLTGLSLLDGNCLYIRWNTNDLAGSGQRDEFGLDNISVALEGIDSPVIAKSPNSAAVCEGTTLTVIVSTPGSGGGENCTDMYRYSTDNGTTWTSWSPSIPSFSAVTGTNLIQSWRDCPDSDCSSSVNEVSWVVNANPVCEITGPDPVCANSEGNSYEAPMGLAGYEWSVTGNGSISGPDDAQTVSVDAGAGGTYTVWLTVTNADGCTSSCSFEVTMTPEPDFTFTATTTNGSSGTGNTDGGPNLVTIYFCPGEYFSFSGYSSVPGTQVGYLEEIPSGTDNVTYNGNAVTVPRAQQDFGPASAAALFSGPFGPYDLSSGTSGSLTQTYTAYYDADNSGSYTDGDCLGETITLVYHINATPLLETTINPSRSRPITTEWMTQGLSRCAIHRITFCSTPSWI
ncbi:MAG: hypothetical protein IPH04_08405 [Saprospirales bacterium]|nr:hypothetical protein [Saprospirales bacterium]